MARPPATPLYVVWRIDNGLPTTLTGARPFFFSPRTSARTRQRRLYTSSIRCPSTRAHVWVCLRITTYLVGYHWDGLNDETSCLASETTQCYQPSLLILRLILCSPHSSGTLRVPFHPSTTLRPSRQSSNSSSRGLMNARRRRVMISKRSRNPCDG